MRNTNFHAMCALYSQRAAAPNVNRSVADAYAATKDWGFSPNASTI